MKLLNSLFFVSIIFLIGCDVKISTKPSNSIENSVETCNVYTNTHTYKGVVKDSMYYSNNDYSLNFTSGDGRAVSTNSYDTICQGSPYTPNS